MLLLLPHRIVHHGRGPDADSFIAEIGVWTGQGISGVPAMVLEGKYLVTGAQGLDNYTQVIQQIMAETIHAVAPQARLVRLTAVPVIGAVLLGMEAAGLKTAVMRHTLIKTMQTTTLTKTTYFKQ